MNARRLWGAGLVLLALFFARAPLLGQQTFFLRDLHAQWQPQVESFVQAVAEGAWPVWDPYPAFGQPMLGNPNAQVLYPLTWLNLVLRPWTFYALYLAAHLALAGLGARAAARRLGASELAAGTAGALWMASGPLLSLGNLWNHLAGAAWLGWAVAAALSPGPRAVLGWGAAIGLMVLAGSPDMALLGGLATGGLGLALEHGAAEPARRLARAAAAALFALALSAGQWWPALDWAQEVGRLDLPRGLRTYWSVEPAALWQALLPVRWGTLSALGLSFEGREPFLLSVYVGLPTLGLAWLGTWRRPRRAGLALAALAAVAILVSVGDRTPVYGLLADTLAWLRPMRFPAKALVPAGLLVALSAALGLDAWREAVARASTPLALAPLLPLALLPALAGTPLPSAATRPLLLAALMVAGLAWGRGRPARAQAVAAALALAALADLAWRHIDLNPTAPREVLALEPPVAAELRNRRSLVFDYDAQPGLARRLLGREVALPRLLSIGAVANPAARLSAVLALRGYPAAPIPAVWRSRGSYARDLLGLQPREYGRLSGLVLLTDDPGLRLALLRLASVERVVALHRRGLEGLAEKALLDGPTPEPVRVLEVPDPLPRAYAVGRARIVSDGEGEQLLVAGHLQAGSEVLLAQPGSGPGVRGGVFSRAPAVVWREERADRLRFELDLPAPGWLVVNDLWAPAWRASVDGRPAAVERANLLFRAVAVPAGRHAVELACRPRGLLPALLVSLAAAGLGVALLLPGAGYLGRQNSERRPK